MSLFSPVFWHDGMFMKAHHFQQQDRHLRHHTNFQNAQLSPLGWGITKLDINSELLALGKIGLTHVSGVMPDRTPFSLPDLADMPDILEVDPSTVDETVYLCCPLPSEREQVFGDAGSVSKYRDGMIDVYDADYSRHQMTQVKIGRLQFCLKLEKEDRSSFTSIPIMRIAEVKSDGHIGFDNSFIPSCIDICASDHIMRFVGEFSSMLKHRATSITERLGVVDQQGVSSVADIMLLQLINRIEPVFNHIKTLQGVHPERLFQLLIEVEGELSTLCTAARRPIEPIAYTHHNLAQCVNPYIDSVRRMLGVMSERRAIPLSLKEQGYGIRVAHVAERSVLTDAVLVLAVKADVTVDVLHTNFVAQTKVGNVRNIRDLINLQLPGIALKAMPVVPRQLPYHAGYTYFEMKLTAEDIDSLANSGALAMHVSGEFPGLTMQLWAVKS